MRYLLERLKEVNWYSRLAVELGVLTMMCFYLTAAVAYIVAPHVPNYLGAMGIFRGSLEAAPASLVSAICAAVICDLAYRDK